MSPGWRWSLRIGIDVTAAITGSTGISRYVTELAGAIEASDDPEVELARFAIGRGVRPAPPRSRHLRIPLRVADRVWQTLDIPRIDQLVPGISSLHASGPVLPPSDVPVVAVVQDVLPLDRPDLHPTRDVAQLQRYVDGLGRAAAVIVTSAATRDRLVARGGDPDRIHIVPLGLTPLPDPVEPPIAGRAYVLAVGAPVPRKGFDVLVRAMQDVDEEVLLALVGPPGPQDAVLADLARTLGLGHRIVRVPGASDEQLSGWYRSAAVLAAPSVDEGFGLPVIEALSVGTPVVATDIAAFREVTAGHATLVPVGDAAALAEALRATLAASTDGGCAADERVAHACRFTWAACARATIDLHRNVAGR